MSVKIMGLVWDLDLPQNEKFVLLAYADHADHNGDNMFPGVALIAKKTGYSERSIQRTTRTLEDKGYLVANGKGPQGTNKWKYGGGDILSGVTNEAEGVTFETEKTTPVSPGGDITVSPEPSLTIKEPSLEPPAPDNDNLIIAYEQNIGMVTPMISDRLKDAEDDYPLSWILEAIEIAVSANVRKWSYINGILKRWKVEGKDSNIKITEDHTGGFGIKV